MRKSHRAAARSRTGVASDAAQVISKFVHTGMDTLREQARSQASHFGEFARERGGELLREQKDRVANEISAVGQALRSAADKLHDGDADGISGYVDSAADRVTKLARFVQHSEIADMGRDVERFVRRHPVAVLSGLFVVGLVGGRFVRVGLNEST